MIKITYPPYQPKIKAEAGGDFIFDEVRKKWVMLTPEEWVRQNFLQYLTRVKKYAASLIAVEKQVQLNDLKKRFDIVVYKDDTPWMIVECKAMEVALDESVHSQILRYNLSLQVQYLVYTNGHYCRAFAMNDGVINELEEFPA